MMTTLNLLNKKVFYCIFLIIFHLRWFYTFADLPQEEVDALIEFHQQLNGEDWRGTPWPVSSDNIDPKGDAWMGLKFTNIDGVDHVKEIWLDNKGLVGSLPESIKAFSELTHFQIANCIQVSGNIPKAFGELKKLQRLDFYKTSMSGQIPSEIGESANLNYLRLYQCDLEGNIPLSLGNLHQLVTIDLRGNYFNGEIPVELTQLNKLKTLYLGSNDLTEWQAFSSNLNSMSNLLTLGLQPNKLSGNIPDIDAPQLQTLSLGANDFTGAIPASFSNMQNLVNLSLHQNKLNEWPSGNLGNLKMLKTLNISNNLFDGELPAEVFSMSNIENLYLANNQFSSMGNAYVELKHLRNLDLSNNNLSGEIPSTLSSCNGLVSLNLSYNKLQGDIPHGVFYGDSLTTLKATHNQLNGISSGNRTTGQLRVLYLDHNSDLDETVFTDISNHPQMRDLRMSYCNITGSIPDGLSSLKYLRHLILSYNSLSGEVGDSLQNCKDLYQIYLVGNQLSGTWPGYFSILEDLSILDLQKNNLTDIQFDSGIVYPSLTSLNIHDNKLTSFPERILEIEKLNYLNLSHNSIVDVIPVNIGNLEQLTSLYLHNNRFHGEIPASISSLSNLKLLSLTYNELSGWLPALSQDMMLTKIYLNHNRIEGNIPKSYNELPHLLELHLQSNLIDGLDSWIGFDRLRILNLSHNQISATLPDFDHIFKSTESLSLQGNRFYGEIPSSIGLLNRLNYLNLSSNHLTGELPSELTELVHIESLYLNSNQLTGYLPDNMDQWINLKVLDLHGNLLSGKLPEELSELPSLVTLHLAGNRFDNIDDDFGVNSIIHELYLQSNALTQIPSGIGHMSLLTHLDLRGNYFEEDIPESFENLSNIERLYLNHSGDSIATFNLSLSKMSRLQTLYINGYHVTSKILFDNLIHLRNLHLENCVIDEDFSHLPNAENLLSCIIRNCDTTGGLPENIEQLQLLRTLEINHASFDGTIPEGLGLCENLITLIIRDTDISGDIPSTLGNLLKLRHLTFHNNLLSSSIPAEFTYLINLRHLQLTTMKDIVGEIPEGFGDLVFLRVLNFSGCSLTDEIPGDLLQSPCLEYLYLGNNQLTGILGEMNLPKARALQFHNNLLSGDVMGLENSTRLHYLNLSNNKFSGTIDFMDELNILENAYLHTNQFSGDFPVFTSEKSLIHFHIYNNELSGSLPRSINLMPQILTLSMGGNDFEGVIPEEILELSHLVTLHLTNNSNSLTAEFELSELFQSLENISSLRLTDMSLSGSLQDIPESSHLKDLTLTQNNITGSINDFPYLPELTQLWIAFNQIEGDLSSIHDNIPRLTAMGLSYNNLAGVLSLDLFKCEYLEMVYLEGNENLYVEDITRFEQFQTYSLPSATSSVEESFDLVEDHHQLNDFLASSNVQNSNNLITRIMAEENGIYSQEELVSALEMLLIKLTNEEVSAEDRNNLKKNKHEMALKFSRDVVDQELELKTKNFSFFQSPVNKSTFSTNLMTINVQLPDSLINTGRVISVSSSNINYHEEETNEFRKSSIYSIEIIDTSINSIIPVNGLEEPIVMTINYEDQVSREPYVSYFNEGTQSWSTYGIEILNHDRNSKAITFSVDHLTDFAIFEEEPVATGSGGGCLLK